MKERPILFSSETVRAILDNRKTQTRRTRGFEDVNKNPDIWTLKRIGELDWLTRKPFKGRFGAYFETDKLEPNTLSVCPQVCPYGQPGDRLWVKETWAMSGLDLVTYKADNQTLILPQLHDKYWRQGSHWRSGRFMPKLAARLWLEIKDVRAERLHKISIEDAEAEGFDCGDQKYADVYPFIEAWNEINARRGHPWSNNDWVWVIAFKRLT